MTTAAAPVPNVGLRRRAPFQDVLSGALAGLLLTLGTGLATLFATSLNMGLLLGADGVVAAAIPPGPVMLPGLVVAIAAAVLVAIRALWWDPLLGRAAAGAVVLIVLVAGSIQLEENYLREMGLRPWWEAVVVTTSQSMLTFAVLGIITASLCMDLAGSTLRRPAPREPMPSHDD
jgi:hypothetical protein